MSSCKLTYFNITGLAEPIRFLLSYGGVEFQDNRIGRDDYWAQLKSSTPTGQVPILEIDGKTLYQSNAINRYLAKKFNLFGSNAFEAFEVDATIETITDLRILLGRWGYSTPEKKSATKEEIFTKVEFYLGKLEALAKKNCGYFVSGKLSAADIVFAALCNFLSYSKGSDIIADYPSLKSVVENVVSQPGIKSYIEKRPKTEF